MIGSLRCTPLVNDSAGINCICEINFLRYRIESFLHYTRKSLILNETFTKEDFYTQTQLQFMKDLQINDIIDFNTSK